ncbi:MAG: peptidoglycan-binding domain-containing protein [Polyangiaceae bacterium]
MVLKRGSTGLEVKILQEQLNTIGVSCDVDSIFGPGTEKAVKTFQTAYNIESDGIVGEHTRIKLKEALAAAGGGSAA